MLTENIKEWLELEPLQKELNMLARLVYMHDTTYEYSDSLSTWRAGVESKKQITKKIDELEPSMTNEQCDVLRSCLVDYSPPVELGEVFPLALDSSIAYLITNGMMDYFQEGDMKLLNSTVESLKENLKDVRSEISGFVYTKYCPSKDSRAYSDAIAVSATTTKAVSEIADLLSDPVLCVLLTALPSDIVGTGITHMPVHGLHTINLRLENNRSIKFCIGCDRPKDIKSDIEGIIRVQRNRTLM